MIRICGKSAWMRWTGSAAAADYINVNVLYDRVKQAGLMPELAGMDLKSATIKIQEFCQANGLTFDGNKAVCSRGETMKGREKAA